MWSLSELEKIQGASAVAIAGPPGRAEPLDADGLARGTPLAQKAFSFKSVFTEPHPALDLRVLVDDPGTPLLCTIKRAAAPAKCAALPKEITASKQGLRLIGTSDDGAAPLIFAGNRGSEGIFRADSGELVSPEMTGGTLSCSKSTAAITRVEPAASSFKTTFRQVRCTSAGCRTDAVQMEQLLHRRVEFAPKEGHANAVDLDGKLLIVWAAGERGGIRMRLAPAETISRAPDVILYDDLIKDGHVQPLSTLFDLKLFSREGFAVLLLGTVTGVHALRIESDGKVTPLVITKG